MDHPDLLMEFAYFLPDAVQDQVRIRLLSPHLLSLSDWIPHMVTAQAKERLRRAVEEAELRKAQRLRAEAQVSPSVVLALLTFSLLSGNSQGSLKVTPLSPYSLTLPSF
jgi:hypothetical protein